MEQVDLGTDARLCAVCGVDISHRRKQATFCSKYCSRKAWKEANPNKVKESDRRFASGNTEKRSEWHRRWRKANPDKSRENGKRRMARWRASNPERFTASNRAAAHRRRVRSKEVVVLSVAGGHQPSQRLDLLDGCCSYCGGAGSMTVDHFIPLSKGGLHVPSNLLPACRRCNCMKYNHDPEQWFRAQPFFTEKRWQQILKAVGKAGQHHGQLSLL